ncbi:hypothetical protein [Mycoplasmopsis gallinacea]|uniref:Uncharacterized protein n=2 Tax=Mycoplasmopsis gallinacea TaxID=29556 RepID=A0A449A3S9_9BACT|nr:hypothetical protein [Mycoplasmopsis gallinacea]VEU58878.1 Uncharacterised protein [Mycoplasmopsis gallinacea]
MMKGYKRKIIFWAILTVVSLIAIILLSVLLSTVQPTLDLADEVELDSKIKNLYNSVKAYSIGGVAFFSILFLMGSVITYSGIKSWRYSEMLM